MNYDIFFSFQKYPICDQGENSQKATITLLYARDSLWECMMTNLNHEVLIHNCTAHHFKSEGIKVTERKATNSTMWFKWKPKREKNTKMTNPLARN